MKFTEDDIGRLYDKSLQEAKEKLSSLAVAEGREPSVSVRGLNGWVFEQTIRYCLSHELGAEGLHQEMREQESLSGRAKFDLLVGNKVAIELKARGSFGGKGDSKYVGYRKTVEERGWVYFYLTRQENHGPYKKDTKEAFGSDRAFFLDLEGDWGRFVEAVKQCMTA